jgi:hypothetical protein
MNAIEKEIEEANKLKHPLPTWVWDILATVAAILLWLILWIGGNK